MIKIPRDVALGILRDLEQTRVKMIASRESSADYAIRVCQAVVAKAGGFSERSQWDGSKEKQTRDSKRKSR